MKHTMLRLAAPLALAFVPATAAAQDTWGEDGAASEHAMAALVGALEVEPLTAEQAARLPLARRLVERVMPPGALGEVMGGVFGGIMGPIADADLPHPSMVVIEQLGLYGEDLGLTDEQAARAATMLDPAWQQRRRREAEAVPAIMAAMMSTMEQPLREVMSELYAVHFSDSELADIDAFFATPSGATYARQSYAMTSDPRLMAAMMSQMPQMFSSAQTIEQQLAEATADLAPKRTFADLSPDERKALADMLGFSVEELEAQMDYAANPDAYYDGSAQEAVDGAEAAAAAAVAAAAKAN